jgi:hypothetical protein
MSIAFCIQCHNFQWRMCWQLSSILQQVGNIPEIRIDIASMNLNGKPNCTEDIISDFRKAGLLITHRIYEDNNRDRFAKRGLVRNDQLNDIEEDWIFFADCDNVYPTNFFENLWSHIKDNKTRKILTSITKNHTCPNKTQDILAQNNDKIIIKDAFLNADKIKTIRKHNKWVAAGCMQVVNTKVAKELGHYVNEKRCKDKHLFNNRQGAKSDIQFRRSLGGSEFLQLDYQIHLNHKRDKEEGKHLEEQR